MSDPRRVVAYSDLLGFSELVVSNPNVAKELLSHFYNIAQDTKQQDRHRELELFLFSDFLFVQGDRVELVVNFMCELYRRALHYSDTAQSPMLIRGGVARGGVVTQNRREAPQVTKNFIVSPALAHAVKMEQLVKGQRLLITAKEREEIEHFWNHNIHSVCYDQPSIKPSELFKKYRYQDLLWARDTSLSRADARRATMGNIRTAERLFRANYNLPKSKSIHYAETLRICLLSYSEVLEPGQDDRQFIKALVNKTLMPYPHAAVWLGFLECVLLSTDGFAFYNEPSMSVFLRKAILAKQWSELSAAFELPEHSQLKTAVENFALVAIPSAANDS